MQKYRTIDGINIQWPWSELIIHGEKTIETRSYALPARLKGIELAIVETPGPNGKRAAGILKSRVIGTIVFLDSYRYRNRTHWMKEKALHRVELDDTRFGFQQNKEKWAWVVGQIQRLEEPVPPPTKRGIIFVKSCKIPKV